MYRCVTDDFWNEGPAYKNSGHQSSDNNVMMNSVNASQSSLAAARPPKDSRARSILERIGLCQPAVLRRVCGSATGTLAPSHISHEALSTRERCWCP